jgi:hypothetical protein
MAFDNFKRIVSEVVQISSNGFVLFPDATSLNSAYIPQGNLTKIVSDKNLNYSTVASDSAKLIRSTSTAITITIANVLSVGQYIDFLQFGSGQITFVAGSGVTLVSPNSYLKTNVQYSVCSVVCVASGVYSLFGDLVA